MLEDIEETSQPFWRELWETRGSGINGCGMLHGLEDDIARRVSPSREEPRQLETSQDVKVLLKKRNWSAPCRGPTSS